MTSTARIKVILVAALALLAVGCHSGGGSGSPVDAVYDPRMPYVGSWRGIWRAPVSADSVDLGLNLDINDDGQDFTGTAQSTINGAPVVGTLRASVSVNGGDTIFNAVITWQAPYGTSKFIGTGGVRFVVVGEVINTMNGKTTTGDFFLAKNG